MWCAVSGFGFLAKLVEWSVRHIAWEALAE
jgi:hypothetical protein